VITIDDFVERLCLLGADRGPRRFPRKARDREILMKSILMGMDSGRTYGEVEINDLLREWNRDVAPAIETDHVTVRRLLVDYGYLERTADGGSYRVGFPPRPAAFDLDVDSLDLLATIAAFRSRGGPPTPYPELNEVLGALVQGVREVLAAELVGVYLGGSFALGDHDPHSDVDFLVVTARDVTDAELPALQALHARLHALASPWAKHLDGSYMPRSVLRRRDRSRRPLLYLDNGSRALVRADHCNRMVVRWVLREKGIALLGPDPKGLIDPIEPEDLREEIVRDMKEWAEEIRADVSGIGNRFTQPYAVLGFCRMSYSLAHDSVVSKPVAARWAMETLDGRFGGLIARALEARADPVARASQPADPEDVEATVDFVAQALARATEQVGGTR